MTALSSEQVAWQLYHGMTRADRHLVDQWMRIGNDRTTAVLAVRGRRAGQERQNTTPPGRDHRSMTWIDIEQQWPTGSTERRRRRSAEHEASHAVVAQALGMTVASIEIYDDGSGLCQYTASGDQVDRIAVKMAASTWAGLRSELFPTGDAAGCTQDRREAILQDGADDFLLRRGAQRARQVLADRFDDVLELADRVERDGTVTL